MPGQKKCEEYFEFVNDLMLTEIIAPALECPPKI